MPAPVPQPVLAPLTPAAIFLVATIDEGESAAETVHDALTDISGLVRSIGFRDPTKRLSVVASIGSDAWDRLFSGPRPAELHPFIEIQGGRHHAPATPGDLLFHIRAESMDVCFELAGKLVDAMGGAVTIVDEVHGFKFFDNRDLMGFVDGTENPDGPIAVSATQIGDEDPDFAGGCYVHVQKYVHDMDSWNSLSTEEQERVIGRTKLDDIEMDDAVKPANSHLALNVITDDDGNELKIVRAQHAVRRDRQGRVRHVLHRLLARPCGHRADAEQHVHRRPARKHRPNPGLLHRLDRKHVLHARRPTSSTTHRRWRIRLPRTVSPRPPSPRRRDGSLGIGSLKGTR